MQKILGSKIRGIRSIRSYSQEYVAGRLGISQNAYSKIERGETSIDDDKLISIAAALAVSQNDILNYDPENYLKTRSLIQIEELLAKLSADMNEVKAKL